MPGEYRRRPAVAPRNSEPAETQRIQELQARLFPNGVPKTVTPGTYDDLTHQVVLARIKAGRDA